MSDADLFQQLQSGATVVTATQRLSRELQLQFDQWNLSNGISAWQSADILPYGAWLERCWQQWRFLSRGQPLLLQNVQQQTLWQQIIETDIRAQDDGTAPLWNTPATAQAAMQAWRLLNLWQISVHQCKRSVQPDHQRFVVWQQHYRDRCKQHNWIDHFCIADALRTGISQLAQEGADQLKHLLPQSALLFHGFDLLTPQQVALMQSIQQAGTPTQKVDVDLSKRSNIHYRQFDSTRQQWLAAANWARDKLLDQPDQRIAIVCPDMNQHRQEIAYTMRQKLNPTDCLHPTSGESSFHISLGTPLLEQPVVRDACDWLAALIGGSLDHDSLANLFLSPFVGLADSEKLARQQLANWSLQHLPYRNRLAYVAQWLQDPTQNEYGRPLAPVFTQQLAQTLALRERAPEKQTFQQWQECFNEWLVELGWPGERSADSALFQQIDAFRQLLRSVSALDLVTQPVSARIALHWLLHMAREKSFQIEAQQKPVQVLGILEASGLQFDAIWFGGLVESDWPPALRPSPFLPNHLQRQAHIPQADAEQNLLFAETLQKRLMASCDELVFSLPRYDGDVLLEASPFFKQSQEQPEQPAYPIHHRFLDSQSLQWLPSELGAKLAGPTAIRGGANLIRSQAICPCCAYASYRLGANEPEVREQGLSPAERGSLVHKALELSWREIGNSGQLHQISDARLTLICRNSIIQAIKRYQVITGCGEHYFQCQQDWLLATMLEWFDMEKSRTEPFIVEAMEQRVTLTIAEMTLTLSIDRIDRFEDGSIGLIDYKTGAMDPVKHWLQPRPVAPQLPLYAISQDEPVSLLGFGLVKAGDCRLKGVFNDDREKRFSGVSGMHHYQSYNGLGKESPDWAQLIAIWRSQIEEMVMEFKTGDARIDPTGEGACEVCGLPGFCRSDGAYRQATDQ